ncbi:hypothetical protein M0R45_009022 [Rubus argutus]|uniref:Uncharacterized protein n=1 Tax=Rubus argutus TaxID=59490 RepID=A0AAW1Y6R5_RUBAR
MDLAEQSTAGERCGYCDVDKVWCSFFERAELCRQRSGVAQAWGLIGESRSDVDDGAWDVELVGCQEENHGCLGNCQRSKLRSMG